MRFWIFILITAPHTSSGQLRETEFECGSHGRFEYCIDGVPGCVVGCHCHPGYYFDTDTKICEPNIRLTQNFRRSNYEIAEPTRIFTPPRTPPTIENPAASTKTAVDEKIDIIAQDADDLGDWLYNQFFKTIENQVINETKDESIITRRSENPPSVINTPTRRSHKYWRSKRKKKKKQKKGLRSKLLRITEDDSLFDSSSSSTSDESSDTSSSSESENREKSREYKFKGKSDHGHKKIVVLNKRPKPPLPSFIFLPNMETPFFPPIGLPAPPVPMYPMVPVPPMMPAYPYPMFPKNGDSSTTAAGTSSTDTPTSAATTSDATTKDTPKAPAATEESTATEAGDGSGDNMPSGDNIEANGGDGNDAASEGPDNPEATPPESLRAHGKKKRPRNKLVQKLRDKLKRKNKLQNYFAQNYQNSEVQVMAPPDLEPPGDVLPMQLQARQKVLPDINVEAELAGLQDVDFKYLSQLIHRADLNRTSQSGQPHMVPPTAPVKDIMLTVPPPSRRNYGGYPDQITQALSNLSNHPTNLNPKNQPLFHTLDQNSYIPDQPSYNAMNRFGGNQLSYKLPSQPSLEALNQPTFNAPKHLQQPNNALNLPPYNTSNKSYIQPLYNVPDKSIYNGPNKSNYNNEPLNLVIYDKQNKPNYYAPVQPSYKMLNREDTLFSNINIPSQQVYNAPIQQSHKTLNRPAYDTPNRQPYIAPDQQTYSQNSLSKRTFNEPTYVSLNKPARTVPHRKKIEDTNDSYYSNLGRQIAAMIRNIDGNQNVDIEIKASSNVESNPIPNENDGSRSYWERFVRSPYSIINSYKKGIRELKNSNEDLYSLENKVSMAALREPTMTLNELENIISQMQERKSKLTMTENRRPYRATEPSKTNFNVNLLPKQVHYINYLRNVEDEKTADWNLPVQNIPKKLKAGADLLPYIKSNSTTIVQNQKQNIREKYIQHPPSLQNPGLESMLTNFMFPLQDKNMVLNQTISNKSPKATPTRKPFTMPLPQIAYKMPKPHYKTYSYTVLPLPLKSSLYRNHQNQELGVYEYIPTTTKKTVYQQLSPLVLNHKKLHIYTGGTNNQFLFEKTSIPMKSKSFVGVDPVNPRNIYATYGSRVEPSYFHHEVHHFDYFDDLA